MSLFEENCASLASRNRELAGTLRSARGGVLEIAQARSGVPSAKRGGRWVHSAYDPAREAETWAQSQAASCRPGELIVVAGVGLLYHVEALRRVLPTEQALAVVVANVEELRDALAVRSLTSWGGDLIWLSGTPESVAESTLLVNRAVRPLFYAPAVQPEADWYARFEQALRRMAARKQGGQLTIAVVGPIYGGSLPIAGYVKRALEQLGHQVRWIDHSVHAQSYEAMGRLKDGRNRQLVQSRLAEVLSQWTLAQLSESPPDLVLSLAQAPLALPVLQHLRKKKFLTAMWFVENHRHLTYWQQMATGYEFWFVIQKDRCMEAFRQAGARQVYYLPMAADPTVHRPLNLTEEDRQRYAADVSFVGAGYANRRQLFPRLLGHPWSFKIWGNEWDGALNLDQAVQLKGARIDTETCMKVFNATSINLNLHSTTGLGLDLQADFVNPRTFELAACGAFQLVDHRSLLPDLFSDGDMVSFREFDEVPKMIPRWLNDCAARSAMAARARTRVLQEHTYVHRMADLLAQVGVSHPDRVGAVLRGDRQQQALSASAQDLPELRNLLSPFAPGQRVELKDLAASIRAKGPHAVLKREELMVLMLDEYHSETRDLL